MLGKGRGEGRGCCEITHTGPLTSKVTIGLWGPLEAEGPVVVWPPALYKTEKSGKSTDGRSWTRWEFDILCKMNDLDNELITKIIIDLFIFDKTPPKKTQNTVSFTLSYCSLHYMYWTPLYSSWCSDWTSVYFLKHQLVWLGLNVHWNIFPCRLFTDFSIKAFGLLPKRSGAWRTPFPSSGTVHTMYWLKKLISEVTVVIQYISPLLYGQHQ